MLQSKHLHLWITILSLLSFSLSVAAVPQSYPVDDPLTQMYQDEPPGYATAPSTYETKAVYTVDTSLGYGPAPTDGGYGPAPTSTSTSCTSTKTSHPAATTPTTLTAITSSSTSLSKTPLTSPSPSPTSSTSDGDIPREQGSSEPSTKSGLKKGEIIGIAIAALSVLVAIIFGLITLYYQRRAAKHGKLNPITHSSPVMAVKGLFSDRAPLLG